MINRSKRTGCLLIFSLIILFIITGYNASNLITLIILCAIASGLIMVVWDAYFND